MTSARLANFLGEQAFQLSPLAGTARSASNLLDKALKHGFASSETFVSARNTAVDAFADLHEYIPGVRAQKSQIENQFRESMVAGVNRSFNAARPLGAAVFEKMMGPMPTMNLNNRGKF